MKLPIPFLLYVVALGLFGLAGWTVYQMLPMWKQNVREAAHARGQKAATKHIETGKAQGPANRDWVYSGDTQAWWAGFKALNLTGKLPPPPVEKRTEEPVAPKVEFDQRPLDQIIELVSVVYDGKAAGKGGTSHVIVRYKQEANVEPPEWWIKENTAPQASAARGPGDAVRTAAAANSAAPKGLPVTPPNRGGAAATPRPSTPMPASPMSGREPQQALWVEHGGDLRREPILWPLRATDGKTMGKIRLVRVAPDAQSAFFVRELPPPAEGQAAPEPKEEELHKTEFGLPQDLLKALRAHQGRELPAETAPAKPAAAPTAWMPVDETTRVGDTWHLGRKESIRDNADQFIERLTVDVYESKSRKMRGLIVRAVDAQVASSFGVAAGEVLLEVNGKKVESKAQTVSVVKEDYNRGVRTFVTKWLSDGLVVERTYQAPDK